MKKRIFALAVIFALFLSFSIIFADTATSKEPTQLPQSKAPKALTAEDWFTTGNGLLRAESYKKAAEAYTKAIELNPGNEKYYFKRGFSYIQLENYKSAIKDYTKVIEIKPEYANAYNNRGFAYYKLGKYGPAIKDYRKFIDLKPDDKEVHFNLATIYLENGEDRKAIKEFSKAINIDPDFAKAYYQRGVAYRNIKEVEKAYRDFDKVYALGYDQARPHLEALHKELEKKGLTAKGLRDKGNDLIRAGKFKEAIEVLTKGIDIYPRNEKLYNTRAVAYDKFGKPDLALKDLEKWVELKPNNKNAHLTLAVFYLDHGKNREAIKELTKTINWDYSYTLAYLLRGTAYLKINEVEKAFYDFDNAVFLGEEEAIPYLKAILEELPEKSAESKGKRYLPIKQFIKESGKQTGDEIENFSEPEKDNVRTNYFINRELGGVWLFDSGKGSLLLLQDDSDELFEGKKGVKGGGNFPVYRYSLFAIDEPENPAANKSDKNGIPAIEWLMEGAEDLQGDPLNAFLRGGIRDYERAITDYERAIRIYPDYADAYFSRGFVYEKIGEYQKAIEDFIKAGELNLHYATLYTTFWWSEYQWRKEHEKLIKDYTKIIKNNKKPDAYISRALLYLKLKEYEKALEDINKAIKPDKKNIKYYHYRVLAYSQIPDYKAIIKDLNTIIELDQKDSSAHKKRLFFYDKMIEKREKLSIKEYKIAARLGSKKAQAHLKMLAIEWKE